TLEHEDEIPPEAVNNYEVDGASQECGKVLFESQFEFKRAPASAGRDVLYLWTRNAKTPEEELEVASVLPDGTDAAAVLHAGGGEEGSTFNDISRNGERVFFTAAADEGPDKAKYELFLRQGGRTIEISGAAGGSATRDEGARFEAA